MIDIDLCQSGDHCEGVAVPSTMFPERKVFCQDHQERLDFIREHLEDKAWSNNIRNKEGAVEAFCESPGCDNRPVYGSDYCANCQGE